MQPDEYLKLAAVEDSMWYFRALHAHVRRVLGGMRDVSAVLDAGCGTGGEILKLRAEHPARRYSGIDFSPLAVELARKRCGPGVDVREASITALPFDAETFDAVVSLDVVCQVDTPTVALNEFYRVLKPAGIAVINVPAHRWMWSYHDDTCQTKHRYVRSELATMLRGAGFMSLHLTHWNALALPLIFAKRKLLRTDRDTSDVKQYAPPIDLGFAGLAALERGWLSTGATLPFGTSIFAVAFKPMAAGVQ